MRATGFEPATVGFGVQRSTVGATPSCGNCYVCADLSEFRILIMAYILLVSQSGQVINPYNFTSSLKHKSILIAFPYVFCLLK